MALGVAVFSGMLGVTFFGVFLFSRASGAEKLVEFLYTKRQLRVRLAIYWRQPRGAYVFSATAHRRTRSESPGTVGPLASRADDDLLALARLLVSKEDRELFGDTEFQVRDIVHRIGD